MNNIAIKDFYDKMLYLINNCGLPVGAAYFVIKDLLNEVEKAYYYSVEKDKEDLKTHQQDINIQNNEQFMNIPIPKEETENEGTNTDASEHSGSINDD